MCPADTNQNQLLCYHVVGTPQSQDVTVLADPRHPLWMFSAEVTDDGRCGLLLSLLLLLLL
jgi:prolyl oligopeptidase